MIEGDYTVYAIKCKENKKLYIGITKQTVEERIKAHLTALRTKKHKTKTLQEDFNKYGEEAFEFYEIETNITYKDRRKELEYMELYKTYDDRYGYNSKDQYFKRKNKIEIIKNRPEIYKLGENEK